MYTLFFLLSLFLSHYIIYYLFLFTSFLSLSNMIVYTESGCLWNHMIITRPCIVGMCLRLHWSVGLNLWYDMVMYILLHLTRLHAAFTSLSPCSVMCVLFLPHQTVSNCMQLYTCRKCSSTILLIEFLPKQHLIIPTLILLTSLNIDDDSSQKVLCRGNC